MMECKKIGLVGSSGGHLTHLYMLKPFWQKKDRFWVTFDKEDARSLLEGERVYPCYYPTNRNLKNLLKNTVVAWKVLRKEKPDLLISSGAAVAVPFFYLVRCVDRLKAEGKITEEVMIQTGFSSYEPKACRWSKLCSYQEMNEYMDQARIVITHGGPSSIMMALQRGKIPIVVPRQKQYEEHVNDHQVEFSRFIEEKQKNIIVVEEIDTLEKVITSYEKTAAALSQKQSSNNQRFNEKFEAIVDKLFEGKRR